jgi:hypothetical protein
MDPEKPKYREAQGPILDSIPGVIQVRQVCVFDRSSTGPPGARFDPDPVHHGRFPVRGYLDPSENYFPTTKIR